MQYLTVGTDVIDNNKFIPINDTDNELMKPNGGMWFTKYYEEYKNYNEWVDYLLEDPIAFYYK